MLSDQNKTIKNHIHKKGQKAISEDFLVFLFFIKIKTQIKLQIM